MIWRAGASTLGCSVAAHTNVATRHSHGLRMKVRTASFMSCSVLMERGRRARNAADKLRWASRAVRPFDASSATSAMVASCGCNAKSPHWLWEISHAQQDCTQGYQDRDGKHSHRC